MAVFGFQDDERMTNFPRAEHISVSVRVSRYRTHNITDKLHGKLGQYIYMYTHERGRLVSKYTNYTNGIAYGVSVYLYMYTMLMARIAPPSILVIELVDSQVRLRLVAFSSYSTDRIEK